MTVKDSYSLAATLEFYEIEELDALDLVRIMRSEIVNKDSLERLLSLSDVADWPKAA